MRTGPLIFSLLLVFCNAENTPTVLWHAMGDSCCNPITMGYFIDTIKSVIFLLYISNFKFLKYNHYRKLMLMYCPYKLETMPLMIHSMGSFWTQMYKLKWCANKLLKIRNCKMDTMPLDFLKYLKIGLELFEKS